MMRRYFSESSMIVSGVCRSSRTGLARNSLATSSTSEVRIASRMELATVLRSLR